MNTGKLFTNALLAEAAYANLVVINDDEYKAALIAKGFSPTQAIVICGYMGNCCSLGYISSLKGDASLL